MMPKTNVLFVWKIEPDVKKHLAGSLSKVRHLNLIFPKSFSQKNLLKLSSNSNVIVGWRASSDILKNAKELKLFINPGTGVKHHIEKFRELTKIRNVTLVNGHGHAYYTAQHAVAMLLSLMNRIIPHHNWMKDGVWRTSDDKDIFSASLSLRNRKIGLLGYGAINKYVHKFLLGFENEFHILKRKWDDSGSFANELNDRHNEKSNHEIKLDKFFRYDENELEKFLKNIDILMIAVPHTNRTENLIREEELKLLGKKGIVVNIARGAIVNEKDLYEALRKNEISGAALDVWYNYNPKPARNRKKFPYKYPFHKLNNIVLSPHRAASPFNDLDRWDEVIENIRRAAEGRNDFLNIVDLKEEY